MYGSSRKLNTDEVYVVVVVTFYFAYSKRGTCHKNDWVAVLCSSGNLRKYGCVAPVVEPVTLTTLKRTSTFYKHIYIVLMMTKKWGGEGARIVRTSQSWTLWVRGKSVSFVWYIFENTGMYNTYVNIQGEHRQHVRLIMLWNYEKHCDGAGSTYYEWCE